MALITVLCCASHAVPCRAVLPMPCRAVLCRAVLTTCCAVPAVCSRHSKGSLRLLPAAGGRLGPGHTASHARPLLRLAPLQLIGWLRGLVAKQGGVLHQLHPPWAASPRQPDSQPL